VAGLGGGSEEWVGRALNPKLNSWLGREAGVEEYIDGDAVEVTG